MRFQTVLLIVALVAVALFVLRRVRSPKSGGYRKRFVNGAPQDSSHLYVPILGPTMDDGGAHVSHPHAHGADCGHSASDGGAGCSDGGGGN